MRFVLFPVIVLAAADREVRFPATCALLGGMSYPLYILHNPLLMLLRKFIFGLEDGSLATDLVVGSLVLLLVWLIWRFYDEPVRAWLRRRYGSRAHRAPAL
jgi:peptidoglycan/LPS O-acetylase OafA/YrhL